MLMSLSVSGLECSRNEHMLFTDLNFTLNSGKLLYVRGQNGSGKTTLLRCLAGLSRPDLGAIQWQDQDIYTHNQHYYEDLIYVGHKNTVKSGLTVNENLKWSFYSNASSPSVIKTSLQKLGLEEKNDELAGSLSAGQKQRLALAKLYLKPAKLWILDEPFTALDALTTENIKQLMGDFLKRDGIIIVSSHYELTFDDLNGRMIEINI